VESKPRHLREVRLHSPSMVAKPDNDGSLVKAHDLQKPSKAARCRIGTIQSPKLGSD
jgi:hypothetical protein